MSPIHDHITAWLDRLAVELDGDDPAVRHDALSDAREHLIAAHAELGPDADDAAIASLLAEYGDPTEVAESYRAAERLLHGDAPTAAAPANTAVDRPSPKARWFAVVRDVDAWSAVLYLLLALPLGVGWFTWAIVGGVVSGSLLILVVGVPLALAYLASIRAIALLDGRLVEALLGERMPRRARTTDLAAGGVIDRVKFWVGDRRTWTSIVYLITMLPLGVLYGVLAVVGLSVSASLTFSPLWLAIATATARAQWTGWLWLLSLPALIAGICLLLATLHAARGVGALQGRFAKMMLVGGEGATSRRRPVAAASSLSRALTLLLIALLLGGGATLGAAGIHRSTTSVHTERLTASAVTNLELDVDNADVRLVADSSMSSREVRVVSRVTTFAADETDMPAVTLETTTDHTVLHATCEDTFIVFATDCEADIAVHVPSDGSIDLAGGTSNGDLELADGLGRVEVHTDNGDITGLIDAPRVAVSTDNGTVTLRLADSVNHLGVETSNGDVELAALGRWDIDVHTDQGSKDVAIPSTPGAARTIHVYTNNGDVVINNLGGGN